MLPASYAVVACEPSVAGLVKREFRAGNGYWYGLNMSVITDKN